MTYDDVMAFVKENPVCTIATVEGDQPRVRGFLTVTFDDDVLYFTTGTMKNVYRQLSENPRVELCYLTPDYQTMLRVTGEVAFVDDRAKKQKLIDERDYLKGFNADDPAFVLLKIARGEARFWTLKENMKENDLEIIAF